MSSRSSNIWQKRGMYHPNPAKRARKILMETDPGSQVGKGSPHNCEARDRPPVPETAYNLRRLKNIPGLLDLTF